MALKLPKTKVIEREKFILDACANKNVLHLGCTDSSYLQFRIQNKSLLHLKLMNVATKVTGVDIDNEGLNIMRKEFDIKNLHCHNIQSLDSLMLEDTFDVVLAADVIEHLDNPGLFLRGVKRFLKPESLLILATVNTFTISRTLKILIRRESVHPDHTFYFSFSTLSQLLSRHRFQICDFCGYSISKNQRPLWNYSIDTFASLISPWFAPGIGLVAKFGE